MTQAAHNRFRSVFKANFDDIQAYCLRRLPPDDAADATAEVFTIAWRRIDSMPAGANARLWLFGVARNVVRNTGRSSRRRSRTTARLRGLPPERATDPQYLIVASSEHHELMAAFHRLNSSDQEVLQLRLWEELSVEDTANVLGINKKAASKRYQRALERLGDQMAQPVSRLTSPRHVPRGGEQ